jgi:acylphosphatase
VEDLIVVLAHKGELEAVFGRVDGNGPRLGVAVEAVDHLALDASEVDGLLQSLDDAVVAVFWRGREEGRVSLLLARICGKEERDEVKVLTLEEERI